MYITYPFSNLEMINTDKKVVVLGGCCPNIVFCYLEVNKRNLREQVIIGVWNFEGDLCQQ